MKSYRNGYLKNKFEEENYSEDRQQFFENEIKLRFLN